jgi:endonuclease III
MARNPACDRCLLADLCPSVDLTKITPPPTAIVTFSQT